MPPGRSQLIDDVQSPPARRPGARVDSRGGAGLSSSTSMRTPSAPTKRRSTPAVRAWSTALVTNSLTHNTHIVPVGGGQPAAQLGDDPANLADAQRVGAEGQSGPGREVGPTIGGRRPDGLGSGGVGSTPPCPRPARSEAPIPVRSITSRFSAPGPASGLQRRSPRGPPASTTNAVKDKRSPSARGSIVAARQAAAGRDPRTAVAGPTAIVGLGPAGATASGRGQPARRRGAGEPGRPHPVRSRGSQSAMPAPGHPVHVHSSWPAMLGTRRCRPFTGLW